MRKLKKIKVLLGLPDNENLKDICDALKKKILNHGYEAEIAIKYSKIGVLKFLDNYKEYDRAIIQQHLEMSRPYSINELDELTDKFPRLNLIIIIKDEHDKTPFMQELFNSGIYNAVFDRDAYLNTLVALILNGRAKKETKQYYDLENLDSNQVLEDKLIVSQEQLESVLDYLQKSNEEELFNNYDFICSKYNEKQNIYIGSMLSEDLKKKLSDNHNFFKYHCIESNKNKTKQIIDKAIETKSNKVNKSKDTIKIIKEVKIASDYRIDNKETSLVIGIIGVEKGVGGTTTSVNLSYMLAANDYKTMLIDLDLINRDIYYYFCKDYTGCLSEINHVLDFSKIEQKVDENLVCISEYRDKELDIKEEDIINLINYGKQNYRATIIDINLDTLDQELVRSIIQVCDKIILVLDQRSTVLDRVEDNILPYQKFLQKTDLLINQYQNIKYFTDKYILNYFDKERFKIDFGYCFTVSSDRASEMKGLSVRQPGVSYSPILKKEYKQIIHNYYGNKLKKFKLF